MQLFLRYDLSKRYGENFFCNTFYNWQSELFIRFVSKKDLKKCSIKMFFMLHLIKDNIISKLQDLVRDNCIPTLVFFILKHEPCKKILLLRPFLLTLSRCTCNFP